MEKKEVVVRDEKTLLTRVQFDEPKNFGELLTACKVLVASKILPKELDTEEKCAVVILTGRELGLRMMASTRGIYVVNQKPALSAQMMLALAQSTGELEDYLFTETGSGDTAKCTMKVKRTGRTPYTYTFSVEMAKKLGKYANEWLKQPENMCKQRAISGNLRVTFPDAILGMYTPEEIKEIDVVPSAEPIAMPKPLRVDVVPAVEAPVVAVTEDPIDPVPHTPETPKVAARPLPAGYEMISAKMQGFCKGCKEPFPAGTEIAFNSKKGLFHYSCVES